MYALITYDVSTADPEGEKRLRRVAKICERYGQRVQLSVFECLVTPTQLLEIKEEFSKVCDYEKDSVRIYNLGKNWESRVEHIGAKPTYNPEGLLCV